MSNDKAMRKMEDRGEDKESNSGDTGKGGPHHHMNDGPEKKAHHVIAKKMR